MSTLRIEVGGVQYDSFIEGSVEIRLDSLASSFSFDTSSKNAKAAKRVRFLRMVSACLLGSSRK